MQGFDRQRKKVGKVQRKQTKSVNNSAKNWEKGRMARRIDKFVYFQCLMYVTDAK
jgi:hypothetical protein